MPVPLFVRPIPIKRALIFNECTHRRLPKLQGAMFAVRLIEGTEMVGTAIVGRPTGRNLDNGERLQVLRVAVIEGTKNGCSMLYGACARMSRNAGATDLLTYIHENETGVSLKAAGWIFDDEFVSSGGEWDRPSRPRGVTVESEPKLRYWAPWSEIAKAILARKGIK